MEPFEERLIAEQKEIKERLAKLTEFINSEKFYALSHNKRLVLKNQKIAMELYLSVLNMRVFEDVDKIKSKTAEHTYTKQKHNTYV